MSDRIVQLGHQMCSKTAQDARQILYLAFWNLFASKRTFPVPNLIDFGTGKVYYSPTTKVGVLVRQRAPVSRFSAGRESAPRFPRPVSSCAPISRRARKFPRGSPVVPPTNPLVEKREREREERTREKREGRRDRER